MSFFFSDVSAVIDCFLFDIARSSQINARIGVDPNLQCIALRLQAVSLNHYRKSGFCYHLYYQRIIRTHETHTARLSRMMMGLAIIQGCHPSHLRAALNTSAQLYKPHTITTIKAEGRPNIYVFTALGIPPAVG